MPWSRSLSAAVLAASLGACGGGGGASSPEPDPPPTAPAPPPTAPAPPLHERPLNLEPGQADVAAGLVLDPVDLGLGLAHAVQTWLAQQAATRTVLTVGSCANGGGFSVRTEDSDRSATLSAGDGLTITLSGCRLDRIARTLDGQMQGRLDAAPSSSGGAARVQLLPGWRSTAPGQESHLVGSLAWTWSVDGLVQTLSVTAGALERTTVGGGASRVDRYHGLTASRVVALDTARTATRFAFRLDSETLGGRVDVDAPLAWSSWFDTYPDVGQARLRGAGDRALLIAASDRGDGSAQATLDGAARAVALGGGRTAFLWSAGQPAVHFGTELAPAPVPVLPLAQSGLRSVAEPQRLPDAVSPMPGLLQWQLTRPLRAVPGAFVRFEREAASGWGPARIDAAIEWQGANLGVRTLQQFEPGQTYRLRWLAADGQPLGPLVATDGQTLDWPDTSLRFQSDPQVLLVPPPLLTRGVPATLIGDGMALYSGVAFQWRQLSGPALLLETPQARATVARFDAAVNGVAELELEVRMDNGQLNRRRAPVTLLGDPGSALLWHVRNPFGAVLETWSDFDALAGDEAPRWSPAERRLEVRLQADDGARALVLGFAGTPSPGPAVALPEVPSALARWLPVPCTGATATLTLHEWALDGAGGVERLAAELQAGCGVETSAVLALRWRSTWPLP